MLHILYGADDYRRQQRLSALTDAYTKKYALFSAHAFDFEDPGAIVRFRDLRSQQTMFDGKKLAIVRNILADADASAEALLPALADPNIIALVTVGTGATRKQPGSDPAPFPKALSFLLQPPAVSEQFDPLASDELPRFLVAEVARNGISISDVAAKTLVKRAGDDLFLLFNEIEKLFLLAGDPGRTIEEADVIADIPEPASSDLFGFINSVSQGKPHPNRFHSLERLFIASEEPALVFNVFAKSPYIGIDTIRRLADYDILVKSGKLDYDTVFVDMAIGQ